ncbi:MAG: hypothetical protein AMXMBFR64_26020 [Myxococcales bacterium]
MGTRQRFRVIEKIDMGGMAEIYRGRAMSLEGIEKEVAIKRVLPQLTKNRKFVAMFLDEARLSMHLNHANIVQVFDVGRADDTYFIVMEYVDGFNLRRLFQKASERNIRIPVEIAIFIAMEVCKGLAHAHEKRDAHGKLLRIVHRDVSPPNVLISRAGEVKLTDFGLAKAVTQLELTDPGIVKGKFSYLSPEAAEGKEVDHRADIFAVGTVLFELLTNRRLFLGKTDLETVELVQRAEIPSVSKLNADLPPEFEKVLLRVLSKDPKKRYMSCNELANDLAGVLFSRNMKVTSYDLAQFARRVFEQDESDTMEDRIGALIQEEILNLSTIGLGIESTEGRQALTEADLTIKLPASSRVAFADIWRPPSRPEIAAVVPSARPPARPGDQGSLVDMLEGKDPEHDAPPAVTPRASVKGGTMVAVGVVLTVLVAVVVWLAFLLYGG